MSARLQVIVQAGGRGSRLRHHTWNKPKCLVSVHGRPILYHLFARFPDARFHIIGDYAYEQLEKYLQINPPCVEYDLVRARGPGTCGGVADALKITDPMGPLLLIWSDLIVGDLPAWPETEKPVICITDAFTCRWTISDSGMPQELVAPNRGIPGMFYFPTASLLSPPPEGGEFVRWFAANVHGFDLLDCPDLKELGDLSALESEHEASCHSRFFNEVTITADKVIKKAVDPDYQDLISKEIRWYKEAGRLGFRRMPKIIAESPLTMERVQGEHLFQIRDLTLREQRSVFADYIDSLTSLHDRMSMEPRPDEVEDVYLTKTIVRVNSVASIIPGFDRKSMTINGRKCRNIFADQHEASDFLRRLIMSLQPARFHPIHGDPTFSNTLVDNKLRTWFIDPRGYFSKPGIMGDPWYDFAKVYYSAVGSYDAFNRRKFKLYIDNDTVEVLVEDPQYQGAAREIFSHYFGREMGKIYVLNGLIWLSLSGYARDDIDSVIGAFYLGLFWLEAGVARL